VDEDPRPGRFLLTGSANLLTIPRVADSLAGRMAIVDLFPLSVSEVRKHRPSFLKAVFQGQVPESKKPMIGEALMEMVFAGGYPEARARNGWSRQRAWCLDYARAVVERDVRDIAQLEKLQQMPRLLRILALHSGQLLNYSKLGAPLGLSHVTTQKYAGLFEQLFLTRILPPWSNNELSRLIKTPKLHFLDSGLLAALRELSPALLAVERGAYGALLETFVFSEVLKAATWGDQHFTFSHYRDKEQNEVDIVVENQERKIVGIEVKASATVTSSDFAGLRKLADAAGKRFAAGLVLYDGDKLIPWGPNQWAAPISSLWA
jgi:predicted AAA+ superfamily ATPase